MRRQPRGQIEPPLRLLRRQRRDLTARGFEVWFDRMAMPSRAPDVSPGNSGRGRCARAVGAGRGAKSRPVGLRAAGMAVRGPGRPAVAPILREGDYSLVPDELKLLHEDFRDRSRNEPVFLFQIGHGREVIVGSEQHKVVTKRDNRDECVNGL